MTTASSLTPLQRAFTALEEARARLALVESAAREPIAIIGLGCRVPGGGVDAASFWQIMRDGVDAIGPMPAERWDADALYDPDPSAPGRISTRAGGFIGSIDQFDAGFFGISPREAQGMDPQQRLLLEVAWEALEHAGQAPGRLEHSATGVFVGLCSSDYAYLQLMSEDRALLDAHFTSGIAHSIVSGRLSYLLGLQGPSLTIDTACSSSLVAVHLACQSLRSGESRLALAGGVNLILSPELYIALSHSRMLAPDGRCKTFDASADGFARGEGCGMVVLKRLSDANTDGDRVLAVIRGSAVNQDGPSSGLTAPNGPAQEAVVRQALACAGVAPRQVGFVEAHGTGTQLGDPLEVNALSSVFAADRDRSSPLLIGSVKTNVGHLEAAAGITGLIKLVLALRHRVVPAHLHFRDPSPHISWDDQLLRVPTQALAWEPIDGRRIGGVSSFGFSGTNAHVVVEEAPAVPALETRELAPGHWLLALSARSEAALAQLAARHAARVAKLTDAELSDYCYTANAGRSHFAVRAALLVCGASELRAGLSALAEGRKHDGLHSAHVNRRDPPRIAFLFTGQGAQYAGMARGVYEAAPAFRTAFDECAALLEGRLERSLHELIFAPGSTATSLDNTANTQPALFVVEYALAQLWRSLGIVPNVVMGHSVGELVAACLAGVWTLPDALALVAERGRLMQSLPAGGAMAAVFAPESQVVQALASQATTISVAAVNGPGQTVISGTAGAVARLCESFMAAGVLCKALPVSHAFHSPLVEPILDDFERAVAAVKFSAPRMRLVSNVSGRLVGADEVMAPAYWRRHVREAVRFSEGLKTLASQKPDLIVEVGPHPTLLAFVNETLGDSAPTQVASLRNGRDDWFAMQQALVTMYLAGAEINWRGIEKGLVRHIVDVPSYPFQRQRYWFQAAPKVVPRRHGRDSGHPLLGTWLHSAGTERIFESRVSADVPLFVRQHMVQGRIVLPATAYLDALFTAARILFASEDVHVTGVTIHQAMLVSDDGKPRSMQLVAGAEVDDGIVVTLSSTADCTGSVNAPDWVTHVTAQLRRAENVRSSQETLDQIRGRCNRELSRDALYARFARRGLEFGAAFQSVQNLWRGNGESLGEIQLSVALELDVPSYSIHPVLLDGCLQVLSAALADENDERLFLPVGMSRFSVFACGTARCFSHVALRSSSGTACHADVSIFDLQGSLVAQMIDVQLHPVAADALARIDERWLDNALYEIAWRPVPLGTHHLALPAVAEMLAAGDRIVPKLHHSSGIDAYDAFLPRLESLCAEYVVQALQRLGWMPLPGETIDVTLLADRLRVAPRHRRLFSRLLAILVEAGHLQRTSVGFVVLHPLPSVNPTLGSQELGKHFASASAELDLTERVASGFAEALRDEIEPADLLFPGGSLETAERLYRDAPTAQFYNGLVAEMVAASVKAAGSFSLRLIEVGAGTGGTTAHVLPRLPAQGVEYTFSDIGQLFVAKARERFANFPFMRYATLDLERDIDEQGFVAGNYHVVIAANVIHATSNLKQTLRRVRQLLAPGGLLVMLEVTAPQRWFDLTVGLTEGWWAYTDTDLRPDYATLSKVKWLQLLQETGFESADALPQGDNLSGTLQLQSLLLARTRAVGEFVRNWLVFADGGNWADALCKALRDRGDHCTIVREATSYAYRGDDASLTTTSPEDLRRLLADLNSGGRRLHGVVHAGSLCNRVSGESGPASLAARQHGVIGVMLLAQSLITAGDPPQLWLLTRGGQDAGSSGDTLDPPQATVWGFARALVHEHPELRCTSIDLDPSMPVGEVSRVLEELDAAPGEAQIAFRGGERRIARLAALPRVHPPNRVPAVWRLAPAEPGVIDSLRIQEIPRRKLEPGEVEIAVEATGLNFKDILNVLGMYPGDPGPLGGECAGRVVAVGAGVSHVKMGDDVLAIAGGSFSSLVHARGEMVKLRPAGMSAEEGASFPIAYLTAQFCLFQMAALQAGERVLVHAAAGGVGMAALRLAQRAGAKVFATAGSSAKRALLRSMGVQHVFDSRSGSFADDVLTATDGLGVDVVLNSLSGELIDASFRAIADNGRFVEIGKRGIKSPSDVAALSRGVNYFVVDWGETASRNPGLISDMLESLVSDARRGLLPPLPRHVFGLGDVARAFRFMAQARHQGKIVLRHGAAAPVVVRRDGTYLVTGGLSGLGPVIARWLVEQGAGRIVLIGRRGVTAEAAPLIAALRAYACDVVAEALDVTNADRMTDLLARLRRHGPPLRGVIHSAGVLADAGLLQQDADRFAQVLGPKVLGAALLDELTRVDVLDFFVLFSSAASVLGSPGQSNHSAANAFLDVLARERQLRGLPGLSINWGPWADVGAAVETGGAQRLASQGLASITPAQGLQALQRLMSLGRAQVAVLPADWRLFVNQVGRGKPSAFLGELAGPSVERMTLSPTTVLPIDLQTQLGSVEPGRRRAMLATFVRERASGALGLNIASAIDPRTPLEELGLDSLLAVELRNILGAALGRALPATLLFDYPTLEALTDYLMDVLFKPQDDLGIVVAAPATGATIVSSIEELSDEEVDRQLAARAR